jgi:hypothetical protein
VEDLPAIKLMLAECPTRITVVDEHGSTALLAALYGKLETVKWLLREGGSNVGEANIRGCTALLVALNRGS